MNRPQTANLIVMCGIQGSGKTTFSEQLAKEGAIVYHYDTIVTSQQKPHLRELIFKDIRRLLQQQKDVIYDDLNLTITERKRLLKHFNKIACHKILHVMNTPIEKCLERHHIRAAGKPCLPDRFIFTSARIYQQPSLNEGWDEIIYHNYQEEVKSYGD